jgi:5-methylthioadenosine/S-adenosylhomocysteine deaminase
MATSNGAKALGMGAKQIAVGQDADIILVDLSGVDTIPAYEALPALIYAAHGCNVTDVMVAGKFLMRDRQLLTINEEEVRYEITRRLRRLTTR